MLSNRIIWTIQVNMPNPVIKKHITVHIQLIVFISLKARLPFAFFQWAIGIERT
jgi:hypothetical protein